MSKEEKHIIKVNRKELSSQEVQEKENLESVLNKHRLITKRPVYKQKRFYFFLFLLLVITLLLYYSDKEEKLVNPTKSEQSK